jgi:glutamate racemase
MRAPADAIARATRLCSTSDGAHLRTLAAALLGLETGVETVSIDSPSTSDHPAQPA